MMLSLLILNYNYLIGIKVGLIILGLLKRKKKMEWKA